MASGADVGAEGVEAFVFGMNRDVDVFWELDPFALRRAVMMARVTATEAALAAGRAGSIAVAATFGATGRGAITTRSGTGAARAEAASASAVLAATAGTALIAALGAVMVVVLTRVSFGGLAEI